jgi:hypothetical protein
MTTLQNMVHGNSVYTKKTHTEAGGGQPGSFFFSNNPFLTEFTLQDEH